MMKFIKNINIGTKIMSVLLITSLLALLTISVISYTKMLELTQYSQDANLKLGTTASEQSQAALQLQAEEYLEKITREQSGAINGTFEKISAEVSTASDYIEKLYADPANFQGFELPYPDETEANVYCSKYMLAPGTEETQAIQDEVKLMSNCDYLFSGIMDHDENLGNIYVGTYTGVSYRYSASNAFDETYDPRERAWFTEAVAADGEAIWLDTYVDSYGSIGITCASAFHNPEGEIIGVVATDITVDSLKENVQNTKIGETGYAFLLDNTGAYIVHPNYDTEGFETNPLDQATDAWRNVLLDMSYGNAGVKIALQDNVESYISYAPIPEVGWTLGVTVALDEIIEPAVATKNSIDGYIAVAQEYIQTTLLNTLMQFIVLFVVCAMILVCFAFILSNAITRPLLKLVSFVREIGNGNLDIHIEEDRDDEVGQLAKACNQMTTNLKENIEKLVKTEGEKERIGAELAVAANIQHAMLPSLFPVFDNKKEFEIYATMEPAKEVGGDFYDFFLIDEDHLAMVMADVSGKGVAAALFMVSSRTLLKNQGQTSKTLSPKEILESVNNQLCENNEAEMFVTVWFGILEISTGKVTCANAGHEHPAVYRKNGKFELMVGKNGFVLAGMEDMKYREVEFQLEKGDKLYLYTDGVAEATNAENELYGTSRMIDALTKLQDETPEMILKGMKQDIDLFVKDAPQFDDITMMAIHYKGVE